MAAMLRHSHKPMATNRRRLNGEGDKLRAMERMFRLADMDHKKFYYANNWLSKKEGKLLKTAAAATLSTSSAAGSNPIMALVRPPPGTRSAAKPTVANCMWMQKPSEAATSSTRTSK